MIDQAISVRVCPMDMRDNTFLKTLHRGLQEHGVVLDNFDHSSIVKGFLTGRRCCDVIHLHFLGMLRTENPFRFSFNALKLCFVLGLARRQGYKIIWHAHNLTSLEGPPRFKSLAMQWVRQYMVSCCDRVIALSPANARELQAIFHCEPERIRVIPHGHYGNDYPNEISREATRKMLGLDPKAVVFLFLGQIKIYKGVQDLIPSFRKLAPGSPPATLVIAGRCDEPKLLAEIEQAIGGDPNIIFHQGSVPDDGLQVYLNSCDYVVLPYRRIHNSGAVFLAFSYGKKIIAPALETFTELAAQVQEEDQLAWFYDPDSPDGLTKTLGICRAIGQQPEAQISQRLLTNFDWTSIQKQVVETYHSLLTLAPD